MRRFITINLISNIPELAETMRSRLEDAGYKTRVEIDTGCNQIGIAAGNAFDAEIEEVFRVRAVLLPFQFKAIIRDHELEHFSIQVHLGVAKAINGPVDISCPESMTAVLQARCHDAGIEAGAFTDTLSDEPVLYYRDVDDGAAAFMAWQLGMPAETHLEQCDHLSCSAKAVFVDDGQLSMNRRRLAPISIRAFDQDAANRYAAHLSGLGYRIHCIVLDESDGRDSFGTILCNYTKRAIEMPAFQWLVNDLKTESERWLQAEGIDVAQYPFEVAKERNFPLGMHSIVVDLPLDRVRSGELHPYGAGYPGRHTFYIRTPDPEDERVRQLQSMLKEQLGANEISIARDLRVHDYAIIFGRGVLLEIAMQKQVTAAFKQFLSPGSASEKCIVARHLKDHDINIYLPALNMPDRSSLRIKVESNNPAVVDWISGKLKSAGHQVISICTTGVHNPEISLRYGKRTCSNEVVAVEHLLRPLALLWAGEKNDSDYDLEIRILLDFRESQRSVQLFASSQRLIDQAHERLSQQGFGVVCTGIRDDIEENMAADGTGSPTITGYVAWAAGMPSKMAFIDGRDEGPFTTLYLAEPEPENGQ